MKAGISKSMASSLLYFMFDPFTKNKKMFLLRESGLSFANMEMFLLRLDSGDLKHYSKIVNMKRDWIQIENPDIKMCDSNFLNPYSKVLFEQDFFVIKNRSKLKTLRESKATKIVNQNNKSKESTILIERPKIT